MSGGKLSSRIRHPLLSAYPKSRLSSSEFRDSVSSPCPDPFQFPSPPHAPSPIQSQLSTLPLILFPPTGGESEAGQID